MILLINPPVVKGSEPPVGLARLAGALRSEGIPFRLLDLNIEGLRWLLNKPHEGSGKKTLRALKNRERDLALLASFEGYKNVDTYRNAVGRLNHLLEIASAPLGCHVNLVNYSHNTLVPQRSEDLLKAAAEFESNIFYGLFKKLIVRELASGEISYAGISLNYLNQGLCGFAVAGFIKKNFPAVKLIGGGGLVTTWTRNKNWTNPFRELFDHFISGPGENKLVSLLKGTETDNDLYYSPDYTCFPFSRYFAPGPVIPYNASMGCFWNKCSFCPEEAEGNRYKPVYPRQAVEDLREVVKTVKPVLIHLTDNAVSPAFMKRLIETPPGVPWYGFTRVEKRMEDPAFCRALKASGCVMLKLGIESGDPSVLQVINKGVSLERVERVLGNLKEAGIASYVYLLFGTPGETGEKAQRTLELTVRHSSGIAYLNLSIFNMPVTSRLTDRFATRSFYRGDLSIFTGYSHPDGWNRRQIREFLDREFKKHPAIAPIIHRKPPSFTANHAALFACLKDGLT